MTFYAHSLPGQSVEDWETMSEHESRVANLCSAFVERLDRRVEEWGDLLGRWHDSMGRLMYAKET